MLDNYGKKDIQSTTTKATPKKDGEIFKDGDIWKFNWKGSECGYASKKQAEEGLKKVSGSSKA